MTSSLLSLVWRQTLIKQCSCLAGGSLIAGGNLVTASTNIATGPAVELVSRRCLQSLHRCSRRFHLYTRLQQKKTLDKDVKTTDVDTTDIPPAGMEVKVKDELSPGQRSSSPDDSLDPRSPSQDLAARLRSPPVLPEREREYGHTSVPPHDDSRITPVGRKLERKAWTIFEDVAKERGLTKEAYRYAVQKYVKGEHLYRRGATEFVYVGLDEMKRFKLSGSLQAYKEILQAFPEDKFVPTNPWQEAFEHYPRQQQCLMDLLEQMEFNGVIPDDEFGIIVKKRFGSKTTAVRRYRRMMYWMPKFKHQSPYPVPHQLPESEVELALMALRRMCGYVDREYHYTVWHTKDEELDTTEQTFIASAQSPTQQELLQRHDRLSPLWVEGPHSVALRHKILHYFVLCAEPNKNALAEQKRREREAQDDEKLCEWTNFWEDEEAASALRPLVTVHEQEDSTILALAVTGSGSKESLLSWVRLLQRENPALGDTPLLFKIFSSVRELEVIQENQGDHHRDGHATV